MLYSSTAPIQHNQKLIGTDLVFNHGPVWRAGRSPPDPHAYWISDDLFVLAVFAELQTHSQIWSNFRAQNAKTEANLKETILQ